jgi:hypothetical protein
LSGFASEIMISRVVLSVAMLFYASYRDVKTREVSDSIWLLFGSIGVLIDGYAIISGTLSWSTMLTALGFSIAFSLLAGYLGFFGGADLLAFVTIGILNPVPPQFGFDPVLFHPVLFPLSVISNAVMIAASSVLIVLVVNISTTRNRFEGYTPMSSFTKLILLLTGRRKEIGNIKGPPFEYPLEKINEDGSITLFIRSNFFDDKAASDTFNELKSRGRSNIWVSYGLPFLLFLVLGYFSALIFGDFAMWIVSRFL